MISHVQADLADTRDSCYLPTIVQRAQQHLAHNEVQLQELVADTGHSNGFNYALLENSGVTPQIPVFGTYNTIFEHFTYYETADEYRYQADKSLPFRKYRLSTDGNWLKHYWAF